MFYLRQFTPRTSVDNTRYINVKHADEVKQINVTCRLHCAHIYTV